jgi:DNA-binding NtrC family response regulator
MSGTALAERLRAVRPDLKVLRMSGYVGDENEASALLEPATPFLQKPFTLSELARGIERTLEGPPLL